MGCVGSSLVACCSERDKEPVILICAAKDPTFSIRMQQAARGSSGRPSPRHISCGSEEQHDDRSQKAVQRSGITVKVGGSEERARVPSPKVQEYREIERQGLPADSATDVAECSSQASAPVKPLVLPPVQEEPCQQLQDTQGGALPPPLAIERTASDLEVPDPPLAAPVTAVNAIFEKERGQVQATAHGQVKALEELAVCNFHLAAANKSCTLRPEEEPHKQEAAASASRSQEEPSLLSSRDTLDEGDSGLPQPPSELDGGANASSDASRQDPPRWGVNSISGLSSGLASKFREQRSKEASGENTVKDVHGRRNPVIEPVQLEDRLACRFEQQRAKERDGTATSLGKLDLTRAGRKTESIAIKDKVLQERLARQRLKADSHD
mmetsp:Transcript_41488/g.79478  ORF Transcript_41488/g.79478 Transcript_41488/m.79478 type:complete len:382 (-) Transcript_41488:254-1399(-)